jgi:hypothetical protein
MPRYKVRSEGDAVRVEDEIILESMKTQARYLSVSETTYENYLFRKDCHEVNLSSISDSFTILPHYRLNEAEADLIKGGDVLCLLHKELDSYLCAEGNFTESQVAEEPHLRLRAGEKQELYTSNGTCFWQVNKKIF